MAMTVEERFWTKVDKRGPRFSNRGRCWLWTACTCLGYGHFKLDGKIRKAHVLTWIWANGPVPAGKELDHLCRRRNCVRPSHLEPVTRLVNVRRGSRVRGDVVERHESKSHCVRGHLLRGGNVTTNRAGVTMCRKCHADLVRQNRLDNAQRQRLSSNQ